MKKSQRNLLLGIVIGVGAYILLNRGVASVVNGIQTGRPKISSFKLAVGNQIAIIGNVSDFILTILQNLTQLGSIRLLFKLSLPVKNNNSFDVPNNSFTGTLSLGGSPIGQVNYAPTSIPAGQTVFFQNDVIADLSNVTNLLTNIQSNPQSILNGVLLDGDFDFNGVKLPYSQTLKLI